MRYGISGGSPAYQTSECDDTNININGISQAQVQQQDQSNNLEEEIAELNGQEMTPEEALNALNGNGNGEPLLNLERNIVNVCINENDNELDAEFFPSQSQSQTQEPGGGTCSAPIDLVIVLDDTGSMGGTIDTLKAEFDAIISQAEAASQGDLRIGYITFKDDVTVLNELTTDIAAVQANINAETPDGGSGTPEASDLAKEVAVNDLTYRAEALKIVILITDAPPGGADDIEDPEDHQRMLDAAAAAQSAGIKVSDIYITSGDGTDPTGVTLQSDATISGGLFATDPDGTGVAEAISDIIVGCGTE